MLNFVPILIALILVSPALLNPLRDDCPGQVNCPLTGELVCIDLCPLAAARESKAAAPACCSARTGPPALLSLLRDDCPGQVNCPLTGELVCIDLCPLAAARESKAAAPAYCSARTGPIENAEE